MTTKVICVEDKCVNRLSFLSHTHMQPCLVLFFPIQSLMMTHFLGSLDWVGKSLKQWLFVSCYLLLISNVLSLSISDVLSRWWFFKGGLPIGLSLKLLQELSLSVSPLVNVFQLSFCNSSKITSWHFSPSLSLFLFAYAILFCVVFHYWYMDVSQEMADDILSSLWRGSLGGTKNDSIILYGWWEG